MPRRTPPSAGTVAAVCLGISLSYLAACAEEPLEGPTDAELTKMKAHFDRRSSAENSLLKRGFTQIPIVKRGDEALYISDSVYLLTDKYCTVVKDLNEIANVEQTLLVSVSSDEDEPACNGLSGKICEAKLDGRYIAIYEMENKADDKTFGGRELNVHFEPLGGVEPETQLTSATCITKDDSPTTG